MPSTDLVHRSAPSRRSASRPLLALPGLLALLLPAALEALPARADRWIEVETRHFQLLSDAPRERVLELGQNLEELRRLLGELQGGEANTPLPTKIFVFRNESSFSPYRPRIDGQPARVTGYFQPGPHGNYVAIDGSPRGDPRTVIFHEYLHYFADHNFPGIPLWFNEGLAEFYSNFTVEGEQGLVGRPKPEHVAWLRQHRLIPLQQFLAVDTSSELYHEGRRQGVFYAQSWALVHYFLAGSEERRAGVARYLALVADGEGLSRAFREAFGISHSELERELEDYVAGLRFPVYRVDLQGATSSLARVRTLSEAEALYQLGDLLAHHGREREEEALEHLEAALKRDPELGMAWATLGYLEDRSGNVPAALELYARASELEPDHFLPWFLRGRALIREVGERADRNGRLDEEDRRRTAEARAYLRRSLDLEPDFGPSHAALGYTFVLDDPPSSEGIEILLEAQRRLPSRIDVAFHLAVLAARLGRTELARRVVEGRLAGSADPDLLLAARWELAKAELERAVKLLEAGRSDDGLALAEAVLAAASPPLSDQLAPMVEAVRRGATELRRIERYDRAVALLRRGELEEALRIVEGLAVEAAGSELGRAAGELRDRIEAELAAP